MKHHPIPPQRGSIPLVMILLLALTVAIIGLTNYVNTAARLEIHAEAQVKAARAAEAALELNMANLNAYATSIRPSTPDVTGVTTQCNLSTVPSTLFPASAGYTFTRNIAVPVEAGVPVTTFGTSSNSTMTYHYVSEASVTYAPPGTAPVTVTMQRAFTHQVYPLFQYAIFYDGDLELDPGATFTVGGRVHSNNRFYYGTNSGVTLTFNGIVTSVLGTTNAPSPNDPRGAAFNQGTFVFANGTPPVQPYTIPYIAFPCSTVNATNANQVGPTEFIQMPDITIPDPNANDREYNLAGLKILVNTTATNASNGSSYTVNAIIVDPRSRIGGTVATAGQLSIAANQTAALNYKFGFVLLTQDGTFIPLRGTGSHSDVFNPLYTTMDRILNVNNQTIKDYRQNFGGGGTTMNVTTIDISQLQPVVDAVPTLPLVRVDTTVPGLADYGAAQNHTLWNGIVYIHDASYNAASRPVGIELINGTTLPSRVVAPRAPGGGLTIVTDHPAYICGDYNTGGNPPVNTGLITDARTVGGYTVRPAAVMADAVTILSSNWTTGNYNSVATLSSRTPVATTVNAAILAGNVPSTNPGNYSGGAENFPRLLESWSGIRLTISGSMICLYPSQQANSPWLNTGNYYNAASRNWYFEPTFNNPNTLPPGTPNIILFSNGEWVRL